MTISESLHLRQPTRQAKLKAWMATHGVEPRHLAKVAGVSPQMMSMIIHGDRAPKKRLDLLVEAGVPKDLLPQPTSGKPGYRSGYTLP